MTHLSYQKVADTFMRNTEVRDLYWILKGPGLLNPGFEEFGDRLLRDSWFRQKADDGAEWFLELDRHPERLTQDLLATVGERTLLGRYFEALLSFWIRDYLKPANFHHSVPVHEQKSEVPGKGRQTIGEFDFLIDDEHWEAAVKFYLFCGENPEQGRDANRFLGTQVKDRLDLKVRRIFEHQLKLSERPEAKLELGALGHSLIRSKAWVKGALFYPSHSDWQNHPCPEMVSKDHQRGWWTSIDLLDVPTHGQETRWVLLSKHRWLSPAWIEAGSEAEKNLLTSEGMKDFCRAHFAEHIYPLMWAEVSQENGAGTWSEIARGLVVFPNWLGLARAASATLSR